MRAVTPLLMVGALCLVACGTGEAPPPGLDGSPDLLTDNSVATDSPSDEAATSSTDAAADETSPVTEPPTSDVPAAPDSSTTTNAPVGEPADEEVDPAPEVCGLLASEGYETRKLIRQGLGDDDVRAIQATCRDTLTWIDGAIEIEQRMAAFNASPAPLTAGDLICDAGNFSLTITNNVDHPIGVHASMRLLSEDTEGPVGSTLQPLVIWSLDPGESAPLTGEYLVNRGAGASLTCEVDITAFDASPGDADASLRETRVEELAADDPATWLPFLVVQGAAIIGTGDADLAAVVEDVRSTEYPSVLRLVLDTDADPFATGTISVCSASIEQPDDRHISLVYFDDLGDSSQLQHGLFRRGNDDQWRWLSSSVYFDSQEYWDCGTPSSNL